MNEPVQVLHKSFWTPELMVGLGTFLSLILGGVGKLIVDVRSVSKQTTVIHNLVNSRMTLALTTIARLARSIAKLTKDEIDMKIADDAEKALETKLAEDTRSMVLPTSPFASANDRKQ